MVVLFEALNQFTGLGLALASLPEAHDESPTNERATNVYFADISDRSADPPTIYNRSVYSPIQRANAAPDWEKLADAQQSNEHATCRCVGLTIETRPDYITPDEVLHLRRLGCTKLQIGLQSLDDAILSANKRGHDLEAARRAFRLCREAGFKLHAHWMPNLLGATLDSDQRDFQRLFANPDFRPDELKIYPCMLISNTELFAHYQAGRWQPYSDSELIDLLCDCLLATPEYCRLTRVIRDIPAPDIRAGSTSANLRQVAEVELGRRGLTGSDIRAREIGSAPIDPDALTLRELEYEASGGSEFFLQFVTAQNRIAAFLRLRLPDSPSFIPELADAAIIREVHVYGQSLNLDQRTSGRAQHSGLGTRLITRAAEIASGKGCKRLAVISAIGTRAYYRTRGFSDGTLYQFRALP